MAIEIPSLPADRLPNPDWGTAAGPERYSLPAGRLLAVLESAAAPAALLDGLRDLTTRGASADLLVAPDRGLVQILQDGRRIPLTGAARDAVLKLLGETVTATTGGPPAAAAVASAPDLFLAARIAAVDAQVQESRAHAADPQVSVLDSAEPIPATVVSAPLMNGTDADAAAQALARVVDRSGLFLEAHLAQWLRGERSLGQIQDEVHDMPDIARGANAAASESRASRQLDAVQGQAVHLEAPAWPGQTMHLEIARERGHQPEQAGAADAPGLFQATLSLQLPRLGMLRARIRILHDTVGLQLSSEHVALVSPDLRALAAAFSARGLNVAALELTPAGAAAPGPHASGPDHGS